MKVITLPTVSVIIPCRNEEKFIGECLRSIIESDFPLKDLEVIVVDGMSEDRTRHIVAGIFEKYPFIKLMDNPNKIVSSALNIGIRAARGRIIMRMDAHARYANNYIRKCVEHLETSGADNVGGICITVPPVNTLFAQAIAMALSHPFGVGNAYFRIGSGKPRYVDTVPFGCYRREVFDKIGLFKEDLIRNQDDEFNLRLIKNGGKILLAPDIISYYYSRDSLWKLSKMYYQYGYFKPLVLRNNKKLGSLRQLVPAAFIVVLLISLALSFAGEGYYQMFVFIVTLYAASVLAFSFSLSLKKGLRFFLVFPPVFSALHFSYGIGYLNGLFSFLLCRKSNVSDVPMTR